MLTKLKMKYNRRAHFNKVLAKSHADEMVKCKQIERDIFFEKFYEEYGHTDLSLLED